MEFWFAAMTVGGTEIDLTDICRCMRSYIIGKNLLTSDCSRFDIKAICLILKIFFLLWFIAPGFGPCVLRKLTPSYILILVINQINAQNLVL